MKRFTTVLLVFVLFGATVARADEASKRTKAEDLFALLHMDRMMDQLLSGVQKQVQQIVQTMPGSENATPEQKAKIADFQKNVLSLVNQKLGWKALEPDFINLYASTYTEEELDGILTFYRSPVGQKMLEKTPELMAKSTQLTQQKMREVQPQLNQMVQDFMKQMAASTPQPTNDAAPKTSAPGTSTAPAKPKP